MSWLFSQALVEEYLVDRSLDGEQSAPSSGNRTQQAYLQPDRMTDFSRLSRFGMTFKPLTEDRGEELLMSYLAASRAKTSAQPEKAQGSTANEAGCGEKWRGSFAKYDHDSSSWKTHQCSLLGGLDEFSETWPQWGLMRYGECWEQQMSAHRTSATGFGLWPTPTSGKLTTSGELVNSDGSAWDGISKPHSAKTGKQVQTALTDAVAHRFRWPTPTCHNAKETNAPSESKRNTPTLGAQVGGKLNPMWVEWLMGWPLGWTDLKPLETDKCHSVPQQLGESCLVHE